MGVLSGDILVPAFPATIQVAVFMQYLTDESDPPHLSVIMRLTQDEIEMARVTLEADVPPTQTATFIIPKGFATFEKRNVFQSDGIHKWRAGRGSN